MIRSRTTRNGGFTLMELIVVIAIIGILTAIVVPNMIGWRAQRQLQGAARVMYGDLQQARMTAIREAETVSVLWNRANGSYQIFMDPDGNYVLDAGETLLKDTETMDIISFVNPPAFAFPNDRTQFNSRGMVVTGDTGTLHIVNTSGDRVALSINPTGRVALQ